MRTGSDKLNKLANVSQDALRKEGDLMKTTKAPVEQGKVLCYGEEDFQLYVEELIEECETFVRLAATLKQMPAEESEAREELEMKLYGSLSHLEVHARQLREWWDQLDESLPDE